VSLLDRKLFRDVTAMWGQILTIGLVVAAGVAVFVASVSTYNSLAAARSEFYKASRFPDVFVTVKRAPLSVASELAEIPGIVAVEPRIVRDVIVDWPSSTIPVSARVVSLTNSGDEKLSRLFLRRGTGPAPGSTRDVVINEAFAQANGVMPGSDLRVILNGRVATFHVTGIALSPEYVYAVKSGLPLPDDRSFAVLWIDRTAAEAAFTMEGAFNDVAVALAPGANAKAVIDDLDRLLEPYGTLGAIERRDQQSHRFLDDELAQQRVMSITIPCVFLGLAVFLLNVALARLVVAQQEQIAALKALGFPTAPIVIHYLKFVAIVVLLGSALGIGAGDGFGRAMVASYHEFFRLPRLDFRMTPWAAVAGTVISLGGATIGVLAALRSVVTLAPAVAMRPPAPRRFRRSRLERRFANGRLDARRTMILRNMIGRPWRVAFAVVGISFAVPMVVLGLFWRDAIGHMMDVQFSLIERGNAAVTFPAPRDRHIVRDLAREPGVIAVEGQRIVPARLRAGHRSYLTSVIGLASGGELRRPRDAALRPIAPPPDGITLASRLAERIGVRPGDTMTVEVLEGRRRKQDVVVSSTVEEIIGMSAYMDLGALQQLTGEGDAVSAAALFIEPSSIEAVSRRFKELPVIESVAIKPVTISAFFAKIANLILVSSGILTGFAVIIAVGVVYNSARIALQERAWELASLRVLGFTSSEVARILFTEFVVEIALGIPLGFVLSRLIVDLISRFHSNETFQVPPVIGPATFGVAALVVLVAALGSGYLIRGRINRLDLVSVLKTRD
jgi:putative ABC transport system permease protein